MAPSATMTTPDHCDGVETTLNYYLDPALGGKSSYIPGTIGSFRRKHDPHPVHIHDIRGHEADFTLNKHGFHLCKHNSALEDSTDTEQIKSIVYPEIERLLKNITGATRVHVYSHLVRRDSPEANEAAMAAIKASHTPDSAIPDTAILKVTPARFAHVDHSPTGALTVLNDHFPDTATALTKSRWSIINIWRPLKPIKKDPLALCDTRSVPEDDLVPVFAKLPPKGSNTYEAVSVSEGWETLELKANPDHQWYYASDMMPDEVLVFKMFDSKKSVARRVPHTSFTDPRAKNDAPRESMEVRSFVFYDDEPAE